ncbi:winged helix-turn-helix domain-containing protein [Hymenobacter sp. B81]|uniref:winged helix-turn-helix domain-containing protein n=1 Tax=Hymenobacter sp. B81 TaxID=3344878 RepID=UPI0037DD6C26
MEQTLYTDVRALGAWLQRQWGVAYSVSGLTQLLHRLGFSYKLTTPVPCEAAPERQAAFLADTFFPLLAQAESGQAVVYFAWARRTPPTTRARRGCGPAPGSPGRCPPSAGVSG